MKRAKGSMHVALRQLLSMHFDVSELQDLCFDLRIDYESLPGSAKKDKARELVAFAERHGQTAELIAKCRELRPHVSWPATIKAGPQGSAWFLLPLFIVAALITFLFYVFSGYEQPNNGLLPTAHAVGTPPNLNTDQNADVTINARIVFSADRDGSMGYDIYLMQLENGEISRLTSDTADDFDPDWSPDGQRVVFLRTVEGFEQLFIVNIADETIQRVSFYPGSDGTPAWSPDGKRIAFQRQVEQGLDIFVMDADGSNVVNLTQSNAPGSPAVINQYPSWSPDGSHIAFQSDRAGQMAIFVLDVSSRMVIRRLTDVAYDGRGPAWSPDGRQVAFSGLTDGQRDLFLVPADRGMGPTRCTATPETNEWAPDWSPDSRSLIVHTGETNRQIAIVDCAQGTVRALVGLGIDNLTPAWSPK